MLIFHSTFGHFTHTNFKFPDWHTSSSGAWFKKKPQITTIPILRSQIHPSFILLIGKVSSPEIAWIPHPIGFCSVESKAGELPKAPLKKKMKRQIQQVQAKMRWTRTLLGCTLILISPLWGSLQFPCGMTNREQPIFLCIQPAILSATLWTTWMAEWIRHPITLQVEWYRSFWRR